MKTIKLTLIALLTLAITSCAGSIDTSKIKQGMTKAELITTLGTPDSEEKKIMGVEWIKYGDITVSVSDGVVSNYLKDGIPGFESAYQSEDNQE